MAPVRGDNITGLELMTRPVRVDDNTGAGIQQYLCSVATAPVGYDDYTRTVLTTTLGWDADITGAL